MIRNNNISPPPQDGKDNDVDPIFTSLYRLLLIAQEIEELQGEKHLDIYYREVIKPWVESDLTYFNIAKQIKHKFKKDKRSVDEIFKVVKDEIELQETGLKESNTYGKCIN